MSVICNLLLIMSTVEEIEAAIRCLSPDEFWKLTDRLIAQRDKTWDSELEADMQAGRLDKLWADAEKEIEAGDTLPLDEFLDNQKL